MIVVRLRGFKSDESAGYIRLDISDASAAEVLEWLEVPLAMLRDQAKQAGPAA